MKGLPFLILLFLCIGAYAQIDARMFQYPDVSTDKIVFAYAGDLWIVNKTGGTANKLSSPKGREMFPRFSPDGSQIAFSGNYDGNVDIYSIPTEGGIPQRITYHDYSDRVVDWHPQERKILFASSRSSGRQRFNQFFLISAKGGYPEKMALAYAEHGSFSPDGSQIAFTQKTRTERNWKRYRGGMNADIYIYDFAAQTAQNISNHEANDELPMWYKNKIYFMSDRGPEMRYNIWSYNIETKEINQITDFDDFDIHYPAMGPSDIVFEAGGILYLLNLETEAYEEVPIKVVSDQYNLVSTQQSVSSYMLNAWISPKGERAVVEARGDLFSLPAEKGFVQNLTQTGGFAERYPAWSPDGKQLAYWSDRTGEYELYIKNFETNSDQQLTNLGPGFRYQAYWSPNSKKLAFIDNAKKIQIYDVASEELTLVDEVLWMTHGSLSNFKVSWSADSKWLAYARGTENRNSAIFIFDSENKTNHQITHNFYDNSYPAFDPEGEYLFLLTNRSFSPIYSDFDNSFVYPNATQLAAITLRKDVANIMKPENDEVAVGDEENDEEEDQEEETDNKKKKKKENDENGKDESEEEILQIDFDGIESRMVILPPKAGNYSNVQAVEGKVLYHKYPRSGSDDEKSPVMYFDLEEKEEKTVVEDADGFMISADDKKLLVMQKSQLYVTDLKANASLEERLPLTEMEIEVEPGEEWRQIFNDAWRFERDYFYDPNLHGVDWDEIREKYGRLVDDAASRWDLNYILGEMIAELNASHTYEGGGDTETAKRDNVGYLGVDWEIANGYYRIKNIVSGALWIADTRSPLDLPGVEVSEGDYVLAVNGKPLATDKEPYAPFQGLAGKTVELTINDTPGKEGAKKILVETMNDESRLRHLAWIEEKRNRVSEATGGKVGYIYVRSTGVDGQNELVRQFTGQWQKDGLIIDERFNSGGQIPDRFIELLNRKPLAYWAVRNGKDWQWPPVAHFGPKVMLINGWSGSGGDAFPDYFRKSELGPLVGTRTWGGLIGISGSPTLIDKGVVTVPTFRMYNPDGEWFLEGHGVEPDIQVEEDPAKLAQGVDNQLERAINEINSLLNTESYQKPDRPEYENR